MIPGEPTSTSIQRGCIFIFVSQKWVHLFLTHNNIWMQAWRNQRVSPMVYVNMRWSKDEIDRLPERAQPYLLLDDSQRVR
eukprot:7235503-Karenia_brevis.AAC.1